MWRNKRSMGSVVEEAVWIRLDAGRVLYETNTIKSTGLNRLSVWHGDGAFRYKESHLILSFYTIVTYNSDGTKIASSCDTWQNAKTGLETYILPAKLKWMQTVRKVFLKHSPNPMSTFYWQMRNVQTKQICLESFLLKSVGKCLWVIKLPLCALQRTSLHSRRRCLRV